MTRRRWIADEVSGDRAFLTGQNAVHLSRALRAQPGQQFELACDERVRMGTVVVVEDERVEFSLGEILEQTHTKPITLLLSIFKFDRMEWAIEKVTELGVTTIVPVIARRTETHLAHSAVKRVERWRRIAHEAAQQSRAAQVPTIEDPIKLVDALSKPHDLKIVLAEDEREKSLKNTIASSAATEIALAIGPEGGWNEDEINQFKKNGWISSSLGPRILRAETAAISAVSIALSELS